MIVFASSITEPDTYTRCAERGIRVAAEPDSEVLANAAAGSLFRSYNLILDAIAQRDDVEALVLLHQDAEITDPDFCAKLRRALSDPDVGVVGCVERTRDDRLRLLDHRARYLQALRRARNPPRRSACRYRAR